MARWRERPGFRVPTWVLDAWVFDDDQAAVDSWLDAVYARDPDQWAAAFVELISTPTQRRV